MNVKVGDSNIKNQFNVLLKIYGSLIFGQILFFAVAMYFVEGQGGQLDASLDEVFKILVPVFGIFSMFGAYKIYDIKISRIKNESTLLQKIQEFRTIKIIQWAVLEGAAFLSIVAFMYTGNYFHIIVFLFVMGFNFLYRPSKESFFDGVKISEADKSLLR